MAWQPTNALVRSIGPAYEAYYAARGVSICTERATEQHDAYVAALGAAGVAVTVLPADAQFPDGVFIEDTAVLYRGKGFITRMVPRREGEQRSVSPILRESHILSSLPAGALLEGGDVMHVGQTTYVGVSERTNAPGVETLRGLLSPFGQVVVPVAVTRCLHLKTGATYLGENVLLAVRDWFDVAVFRGLNVHFVAEGEAGAANCLRVGNHLLVPAGYPRTLEKIRRIAESFHCGISVLAISEFEKGDGGLTCLSLRW
jgi:dimethylargininase